MSAAQRTKVFISYSHQDRKLFGEFKTMLAPLEDAGLVDPWDDERIPVGSLWRDQIARAIDGARVAVLLVSPAFLASRFIKESEIPPLLQAARDDGLVVMTVHLQASLWEETALGPLQGANDPADVIGKMAKPKRNEAFKAVCQKLAALVKALPPALPAAPGAAPVDSLLPAGALATSALGGPVGAQALAGLATPAAAVLRAERRPRADFHGLFETVTDPDDVARAVFGVEADGSAAIGVPYIDGREGRPGVQAALAEALIQSHGRLLVCGRGGIGKTREVAELAAESCSRGWVVCLARGGQADAAMGELAGLPDELADARLFVVVDNLHMRGLATADGEPPYVDRLRACLASLERLAPDRVRVAAIARTERVYLDRLALDPAAPPWRGFGLFDLPEFSVDGLTQMLQSLAAASGLAVSPELAARLVQDSDRKPRTLVINVRRLQRRGLPLTAEHWLPREGDSWHDSIVTVQLRQPALGSIFQALRLLAEAELAARRSTVLALAARLGTGSATETAAAADALVDAGLAGLRGGVLRPFGDELVALGLADCKAEAPVLAAQWPALIAALAEPAPQPQWSADLCALTFALVRAARVDEAEQVGTLAVAQGGGTPARRARAAARLVARRYPEVLEDLDAALDAQADDTDALRLRAVVRNLTGDVAGVVQDMDRLLALLPGDGDGLLMRSVGLFNQGRLEPAEADLSAVIGAAAARPGLAQAYFLRAMVRLQRLDLPGADTDLTELLTRGSDLFAATVDRLRAMSAGSADDILQALRAAAAEAEAAAAGAPAPPAGPLDLAFLHGMRGVVRMQLNRFAEAEQDLTQAIDGGFVSAFGRLRDSMAESTLAGLAQARDSLARASEFFANEGMLVQARGMARLELHDDAGALADFERALKVGTPSSEVPCSRALALARLGNGDAARAALAARTEQDLGSVGARSLSGLTRLELAEPEQAVAEFEAAVALGRDDAWVWQFLLQARVRAGALDAAGDAADKLVARLPDAAAAWFQRAAIRYDQERFDDCDSDLEAAFRLGLDAPGALGLRGLLRLRQQRQEDAEADLRAAESAGLKDANVFYALATIEFGRDDAAAAEAHCSAAMQVGRDDAYVHFLRGRTLMDLDRPSEAEVELRAALERGAEPAETLYWRGLARYWEDRQADAVADFDAAAAQGLDSAALHFARGRSLLRLGDATRAREALDAALERQPEHVGALIQRADAAMAQDDLASARADVQRAAALGENRPDVQAISGKLALHEARFEDARRFYGPLLADHPKDETLLFGHGVACYALGDLDAAAADFSALAECTPQSASPHTQLALIALRRGDRDAARSELDIASRLEPDNDEVASVVGAIAVAEGRFDDARRSFEAVTTGDAPAWAALVRCIQGDAAGALEAYRAALATQVPGNRALARAEFMHWTGVYPQAVLPLRARPEFAAIEALLAGD